MLLVAEDDGEVVVSDATAPLALPLPLKEPDAVREEFCSLSVALAPLDAVSLLATRDESDDELPLVEESDEVDGVDEVSFEAIDPEVLPLVEPELG